MKFIIDLIFFCNSNSDEIMSFIEKPTGKPATQITENLV